MALRPSIIGTPLTVFPRPGNVPIRRPPPSGEARGEQRMSLVPLADWVRDARQRTGELIADLSRDQLLGPRLPHVNPLLWEVGHVAWFQEKWVLRHTAGRAPIRADADALYDSAAVPHDTRWDLPLPGPEETRRYLDEVRDRVLDWLGRQDGRGPAAYFTLLT